MPNSSCVMRKSVAARVVSTPELSETSFATNSSFAPSRRPGAEGATVLFTDFSEGRVGRIHIARYAAPSPSAQPPQLLTTVQCAFGDPRVRCQPGLPRSAHSRPGVGRADLVRG